MTSEAILSSWVPWQQFALLGVKRRKEGGGKKGRDPALSEHACSEQAKHSVSIRVYYSWTPAVIAAG